MYMRPARTAVVSVRLIDSDRELLQLAARLTKTSLSSYIAEKAVQAALSEVASAGGADQ